MQVGFQADADLDGLLERNVHLGIAARLCGIHSRGYLADMTLHDSPLRVAKHYNGDGAALQVLLRHHVLVRGDQNFEPGFFGGFQQLAVDKLVPTGVFSFRDSVACEKRDQRGGRTAVK